MGRYFHTCLACGKEQEFKSPIATTCQACLDSGYKYCSKCDLVVPTCEFYKDGRGGLMGNCKQCYQAKREEDRQMRRAYEPGYLEKCRVQGRKSSAEWYATDKGRTTKLALLHKRRAATGNYTVEQWATSLEYFEYQCAYCGEAHNLTVDHVKAISQGGANYVYNLIPACGSCNASKGAKDVVEWYTAQGFYSEYRLKQIFVWYKNMLRELLESAKDGEVKTSC